MSKAKKLREFMSRDGICMAPGAHDAWSARLIEQMGFEAVYMTGYGVAASVLGQPDIGLMTLTEMATMAKNMARVTTIPLIADADTGYGGALNVMRTVQEYESAGVAAIQLEDQITPKRCGHMEGKEVISKEEMVAKLKAAIHARQNPDLVLIARTDARAVHGFDDAIDRCQAYKEAGADIIFFEAPESAEEMSRIAQILEGPLMANMVPKGKTPLFTKDELIAMGYKLAIYPVASLYPSTKATMAALSSLKDHITTAVIDQEMGCPAFRNMIGVAEMRSLEESFYFD